jgi:hypothetical protein
VLKLLIQDLAHLTLMFLLLLFLKLTGSLKISFGIQNMGIGFLKEFSLFLDLLLMTIKSLGHDSLNTRVVIINYELVANVEPMIKQGLNSHLLL